MASRREQALELAEELLTDFELNRLAPRQLILKASRLARLLDDTDSAEWLSFEIRGYLAGEGGGLPPPAWEAARRSARVSHTDDGPRAFTESVSNLQAVVEAKQIQLGSASDAPVSVSSANPSQFVKAQGGNALERNYAAKAIADAQTRMDRVMGTVYEYVREQHHQLRFGAAVSSAVELVRADVDARIATLAPEAALKLAAAYENAASDNPEHWASAAATCRRLLKAVADAVQPPGADVDGRKMGPDQYVNRLVHWVTTSGAGGTLRDIIASDLALLGERLDAYTDAGHKGAHAEVGRLEAARVLTGTYLLLADLLALGAANAPAQADPPEDGPLPQASQAGDTDLGDLTPPAGGSAST